MVSPAPTNQGPKPLSLDNFATYKGNFNGLYLRNKHDMDNRSRAFTTTRGRLHCFKMSWTLVHKRHFHPPYVHSAFYVIATLRRRRLANRTQPNFAKRRTVNRANNVLQNSWGRPHRKKMGSRNFYISSVF